MKRKLSILSIIALSLLLTSCKGEENLTINPNGSGKTSISLIADSKESQEKIESSLNSVGLEVDSKYTFDDFRIKKMYYLENQFNSLEELGYTDNQIKIDKLENNNIYYIHLLKEDVQNELITDSEYLGFLNSEDIELRFSITLNGYILTNIKGENGNYDKVYRDFIMASKTFIWDINNIDDNGIILNASLPPMNIEYIVLGGVLLGVIGLGTITVIRKKNDNKTIKEIFNEVFKED